MERNQDVVDTCLNIPSTVGLKHISYLIFLAAKKQKTLASELLRPLGLYLGQEILLMQLWDTDGQNQTQLVEALGLDASTVTKMLQRLEKHGIVKRTSAKNDRRTVIVTLTAAGKELKHKVGKIWLEITATISKNLTDKEIDQLEKLLIKAIATK